MELRIPDGEFLQYINGQQVEGASRTAAIVCPGNGEFVAKVRLASAEQAQAALEAARDAFPIWSRMSLEERGGWILKLRDAIAEEREALHALLVLESGKLNGHNAFEVDSLINYLTFFLEQAKCEQDAILRDTTGGKGFYAVVRQPLGVVVASLAWNFPLHNAATKLGPILASGCTAVIKPATKTPLSTLYLGRILDRIDFPKGVINLVAGRRDQQNLEQQPYSRYADDDRFHPGRFGNAARFRYVGQAFFHGTGRKCPCNRNA